MRYALLILLWVIVVDSVPAEHIATTDGKTLKNAEVIRFEPDGVIFKHDGGTNQVAWKDLSPAVRQRYQAAARKRKEKEIQKLKQDLARAEAEAASLERQDSETRKPPEADKSAGTAVRRAVGEEPAKRAAELPPLKPDEIMDAAELVQQFKTDPPAADQRYRRKTFRVRGVIERFEPRLFVRKYDVLLESPDRFVRVVAVFDYPNDYKSIYTTQRGQTLVGKPAENKEVTLLRAGQTLVLQGRCKGAHDTEIVFTGCEVVR
ncbi:MAG TPA: hypothetical protein VEL06_05170 [Haliangiales bacterium]|nr:hypothetical protein [Haliangiales bacterium]